MLDAHMGVQGQCHGSATSMPVTERWLTTLSRTEKRAAQPAKSLGFILQFSVFVLSSVCEQQQCQYWVFSTCLQGARGKIPARGKWKGAFLKGSQSCGQTAVRFLFHQNKGTLSKQLALQRPRGQPEGKVFTHCAFSHIYHSPAIFFFDKYRVMWKK